ncbi:MAG: hypothetical protein ACXWEY_13055, partial [Bacteroidia bacterium]
SCESDKKTDENTDNVDTTVVIPADTFTTVPAQVEEKVEKPQPEKQKSTTKAPEPEPEPVPTVVAKDWRAMLTEYHEILCRTHKGKGSTEDKIRQTELSRELMIERKKLSGSDQFKFTAEMARAANMETCK